MLAPNGLDKSGVDTYYLDSMLSLCPHREGETRCYPGPLLRVHHDPLGFAVWLDAVRHGDALQLMRERVFVNEVGNPR